MPESGFVLTPCTRACYPCCRCALSVERPCTGEFPEPPAAPVNGSFYACALVRYTYRGTLNLRGSVVGSEIEDWSLQISRLIWPRVN